MNDAIGIILVLAAMVGFVFGVVNLIKPLGRLKITDRLRALAVVGGSFVVFLVGGFVGAAGMSGGPTGAADASAAPPATELGAASAKTARANPAGISEAEFVGIWTSVKVAMEPCDNQVGRAGEALQGGDIYGAYPLVQRARETCMHASMAVSDVDIPRSAKGEVRKAIEEARERCSTTMFVKRKAMGKVAKVVDGDARPSAVAAAREELEEGSTMTMGCIVGFMSAAEKAGHVLPEFSEVMASAENKE